jgi:filamentous hemagglutinin family protein
MNLIYRSIWNDTTGTFVAVSENARSAGKRAGSLIGAMASPPGLALKVLAVSLMLLFGTSSYALPTGGVVAAGAAGMASTANTTTITQSTQNAVINWHSFGIAAGQTVQFLQPNSSAVALNRVLGSNPSAIFGNLTANGQVFLVNPGGVLFGSGASVNVGGLVASTLNISDANFMAGKYSFSNPGSGTVVNQGTINADGGYVALLGTSVSNQGAISARLGTVALAAGQGVTLDLAGDNLLNVTVDQGAVNALVNNGGLIKADGGLVVMTTQGAGNLLSTVVNNTGVIRAQTISSNTGVIKLLGDMGSGTTNVSGTLDASAPNGGNGGFIETSAANVNIAASSQITTAAPAGTIGNWLIDPQDFIVGSGATDNISGATLQGLLVNNSVTISTNTGPDTSAAGTTFTRNTSKPGNGDIFVNDAVSWTAAAAPTTLTLLAERDVNINGAITGTKGNFVACCGRDINVNAAITMTNGSISMGAGRNLNQNAAITATDGNIQMCAANNVSINAALTLTNGSLISTQSLGLPRGLTLRADSDGTGPGVAGGTVIFAAAAPKVAVTNAPVSIYYNPVSYSMPTDYSTKFVLTAGAALTQYMLVFPDGASKGFDGTTATSFTSLKGAPDGVTLIADPGATANFDSVDVGTNKVVTFSGYSLGGPNAGKFAFATSCCGTISQKTTANITLASSGPIAGALASTSAFSLPKVLLPLTELPFIAASLESPPSMVMFEVPPEKLVEEKREVPPPYVAPVRPRKQGRN